MSNNRIVFQNWIVDLGRDPSWQELPAMSSEEIGNTALLRARVQQALLCLSDGERELIEQFYYMGRSYREISERSGRAIYRLEAIHKRALRKLRNELRYFIQERFHLDETIERNISECPICNSPYRCDIDFVISQRDPTATWKPIMRYLRKKYNLDIRSPQTLIGHERHHMQRTAEMKIESEK
ncbi:MAG: hypothetical protein DRP47_04785 [Candidatus Zixiibacteriota bacterium]|nr:MAG: hypothetical protein DRP47_04785 [candidate division Zixibacteria bacterium]